MRARSETSVIILHHSATFSHQDVGVHEFTQWHRKRGFATVGYHWVIRRDGTIEAGRDERLVGAHCVAQGMNAVSIGICLVGGLAPDGHNGEDNFTDAQFKALAKLIKEIRGRYGNIPVKGHKDYDPGKPVCPAFDIPQFMKEYVDVPTQGHSGAVRGRSSGGLVAALRRLFSKA